jgi:hypothetical protein
MKLSSFALIYPMGSLCFDITRVRRGAVIVVISCNLEIK